MSSSLCDCPKSKEYTDKIVRQNLLQLLMKLNDDCGKACSRIPMMNLSVAGNWDCPVPVLLCY